jgi:alcohol dehydrogenase (cytochrome c)
MRMRFALSVAITVVCSVALTVGQVAKPVVKDVRPGEVANFRPVTEEMLRNPPPEDWLNWRRTDNNWGYSTLNQINTQNVQQMQLVWGWAMDDTGANEATPLVHDGIMYLPNTRGVIQALDAATGDLIWEYRPGMPTVAPRNPNAGEQSAIPRQPQRPVAAPAGGGGGDEGRGIQRNIAIFGDKIFGTTNEAEIVAIEARTGKLAWKTQTADPALGYQYTAGPIVVRGKVIAGITGCSRYKKDVCFIVGLDAGSGRELWRTSSIARPGEPGGDTWGDLALEFRAGGDMWMSGSYDPETNLIYWGTAQAKPWARAVRGTDGAALYTSSTLALDPDTGTMKWYYQHIPGESHDMDENFERILIDVGGRKSLFTMGKLGILWQIDRVTGKFISAYDLGYQNLIEVDRTTGQVNYNSRQIPQVGVQIDMCPSTSGFKSWRSMAYSPQTNAVYVPLNLNCEHATFGPGPQKVIGRGGSGPVKRINYMHPDADGSLGEFRAMDVRNGRMLWRHRYSSPMNTAALTTAGGLVFAGDWDRHMYAYDAASGKVLWQTRLTTTAQGFPITYSVRGRQYVALPAGIGGGSWSTLIAPELRPDIRRPLGGNSIFVFALPETARTASSAR